MGAQQDRQSRSIEVAGHRTGWFAVGAAIGGLAGLAVALFLKKKPIAGDDDSPVIIKSGSISLALRDLANVSFAGKDKQYQIGSNDFDDKPQWDVSVAELEAGFPVDAPTLFENVTSVVLKVIKDNGSDLDTITMTYAESGGQRVLIVKANNDNDFGDNTKMRAVGKSKKHKRRAVSKKIGGDKDFEIASITVNYQNGTKVFEPGHDHALAFTFKK